MEPSKLVSSVRFVGEVTCTVCERTVQWLNVYYDRNGYYSGKACSWKCSYKLPGQGTSRDYEADHREDDLD